MLRVYDTVFSHRRARRSGPCGRALAVPPIATVIQSKLSEYDGVAHGDVVHCCCPDHGQYVQRRKQRARERGPGVYWPRGMHGQDYPGISTPRQRRNGLTMKHFSFGHPRISSFVTNLTATRRGRQDKRNFDPSQALSPATPTCSRSTSPHIPEGSTPAPRSRARRWPPKLDHSADHMWRRRRQWRARSCCWRL